MNTDTHNSTISPKAEMLHTNRNANPPIEEVEVPWQQLMEESILLDPSVRQARILNLAEPNIEPQWAVILSLEAKDGEETDADIIKRARKVLVKKKKETGSSISVPKQWMVVEELPLVTTEDGQDTAEVDSDALRRRLVGSDAEKALEAARSKIKKLLADPLAFQHALGEDEPPATQMELMLRVLWGQVLNLQPEEIAREDSFLRRGGDSILAIELTALAHECGITLTVASVFKDPRLCEMAKAAEMGVEPSDYDAKPFEVLGIDAGDKLTEVLKEIQQQCGLSEGEIIEDAYPCSALQEGLMSLTVKQPGSYITRQAYQLPESVDTDRFKAAWEKTLDLCEILRTRIVLLGGRSIQTVIQAEPAWDHAESLNLEGVKQVDDIDINYGTPLCRYMIYHDAQTGRKHFIWTMHHACFDGWTVRIILDVLHRQYQNLETSGSTLQLRPYGSFIKYLNKIDTETSMEFWKAQLQDAKRADYPPRRLVTETEGSGSNTETKESKVHAAHHTKRTISFPYTSGSSITKATVLRAAWAIVLATYCDTDDVTFGTTVSGRQAPVPGLEMVPGPVLATIPVRIRLGTAGDTVRTFLQKVQDQASEMIAHEQYGMRNISQLSPEARAACDFSSLLVVQPAMQLTPASSDAGAILELGDLADEAVMSYFNYPLFVQAQVLDGDNNVELVISYDKNILSEIQIEAFSNHFGNVVAQLVSPAEENTPISNINVSGEWDLQLASGFNRINETDIVHGCLHEIITAQAEKTPDHEALYSTEESMTYGQLETASNILAEKLVESGVIVESIVPICFEKSIWGIVAMLAIMKAGGAFVPLDPSHPISRRKALVEEVGADSGVIITSESQFDSCQGLSKQVLSLSKAAIEGLSSSSTRKFSPPPASSVSFNNACYVLFTSGSTGKPKGMVIEHSAVLTNLYGQNKAFGLCSTSRYLQFSSYVWDPCIKEIFSSLIFGGTVCVPTEEQRMNDIASFFAKARVNIAILTPSFVRVIEPDQVPSLETLLVGGEASNRELIQTWQSRVRLVNAFGPAEAVVACMLNVYKTDRDQPTNIGRPFHGAMWLVNPNDYNQLTPFGCIGEILINSHALARGYLQNPEATTKSFPEAPPSWLPNSFREKGWRFYKTGDLARYNPDGTMEFMGRKDTQVKLRGQRLELGEIESSVKKCFEGIENIAVDILTLQGKKSLAAFMSFTPEWWTENSQLREGNGSGEQSTVLPITEQLRKLMEPSIQNLKDILPSYMIPSFFIPVREMPFVSAMKIDRRRLRVLLDGASSSEIADYQLATRIKEVPETEMELRFQALWSEVLRIPAQDIGKHDDFLQIGGDSISAIQLVSLSQKEGISLTVPQIFKEPSLKRMAAAAKLYSVIGEEGGGSFSKPQPFGLLPPSEVDSIKSQITVQCSVATESDIEDAFPCTPLQEGLMALTEKQPGSYTAKQVYRLRDSIDIDNFKLAWKETLRVCSSLRIRLIITPMGSIQAILKHDEGEVSSQSSQDSQTLNVALDKLDRVEMKYGLPLCRYSLIQTDEGCYFAWAIHHAIFDGWSMKIVLDTLQNKYFGQDGLQISPFSGFVKYITSMKPKEVKNYWKSQLSGAQRASFPAPPATSSPEAVNGPSDLLTVSVKLSKAAGSSITKATVIRSAWAIILARYCNTDDVCFGVTVAGRHAPVPGVGEMSGPTIATVPVRTKLNKRTSVLEFMETIQRQANDMIPFEQFGLQNISKLGPEIKDAVDFTSLIVVQPAEISETTDQTVMLPFEADNAFATSETMEGYFHYPLAIQAFIHEEHVELRFAYQSDVVPNLRAEALGHHFEYVIEQLCSKDIEKPLGDLYVAGPWDEMMARQWTKAPEVTEVCVPDLINEWVQKSPNQEAIYATDGSLTYQQLEHATNEVAQQLAVLGVKPEVLVPICFEKSVEAIIAMIAILKAGGAFVPLDPDHPVARREAIVDEVEAQVLLVSTAAAASCVDMAEHVLELSPSFAMNLSSGSLPPTSRTSISSPSSTNTAYVLFTSGSTGKPKGVVMEHGALCSSIGSHAPTYGMNNHTRTLQFSSYAFDACITEIFTTLCVGGTVCVPSPSERLGHAPEFMRQAKVNAAMLTPSFLRTFEPEDVPDLKLLILSGEAANRETLETWRERGGLKVINGYGPTECCIYCIAHSYDTAEELPTTIGKDLHVASWIVEPSNINRLAPIGCVGELLRQGRGIARGYFKDEEKTKSSFLQNLDWATTTAQDEQQSYPFYRTGDLARYDHQGVMYYLGRADSQIKLRGQRIELGEVEYHIKKANEKVAHAGVDLLKRQQGDILVAFISVEMKLATRRGSDTSSTKQFYALENDMRDLMMNIQQQLKASLPSHMVPTVYLPVRNMPFVTAMKLDRKQLRAWVNELSFNELHAYSLSSQDKAPIATHMESKLLQLWAQILDLEDVSAIGKNDSFLQIGGDSISAIRLVSACKKNGLALTVADIFKMPRLGDMATMVVQSATQESHSITSFSLLGEKKKEVLREAVAKCQIDDQDLIEDAYPCTPLQEGLMALTVTQPGSYISKNRHQLAPGIDIKRFQKAWEKTVECCTNLRTRVIAVGGVSYQIVMKRGLPLDQSSLHSLAALDDAEFSYGTPLCQYAVYRNKDGAWNFLLNLHHAIYDGWALKLVLDTLQAAYTEAELPIIEPYSNFIQHLGNQEQTRVADFWKTQLDGASKGDFLSQDIASATNEEPSRTRLMKHRISLSNNTPSITKATLIRGAWAVVLARYSETEDVIIGTTVSGRQAALPNIDSMAGPMIATVPVRVRLQRNTLTVGEYLERIQEQSSEMIPFEQHGLQNISKLSEDAKQACDLSSLLIVQPSQTSSTASSLLLLKDDEDSAAEAAMENYFNYPLVNQVFLSDEFANLFITYDESRLSELQMTALVQHYEHVLMQLSSSEPTRPLRNVSLVGEWDSEHAVNGNRDCLSAATESCVHWQVREQVRQRPNDEAVASWDGSLTYTELWTNVKRLAVQLSQFGVAKGQLVPICHPKSVLIPILMLAVQLAGAGFVPVDPNTPKERLRKLLHNTKASLVLGSVDAEATFEEMGVNYLAVDIKTLSNLPEGSPVELGKDSRPDETCLSLFTSGSTGEPKGILIQHKAISSTSEGYGSDMDINAGTRVFNFSSFTFDVGILDVLVTLMRGGCVCIPSDEERVYDLAGSINKFNANWAFLTPTVANMTQPSEVPGFKTLCLGGEMVDEKIVEKWRDIPKLYGGYGPAEASICAWNTDLRQSKAANIGKPISSAFWCVEPGTRNLVPVGCVGELVIQGPLLAQKYIGTSQVTNENWIENADWLPAGFNNRVYRTGDLVRRNTDNTFEYIGRIDSQVKINGQRVELGEIESKIQAVMKNIKDSVVSLINVDGNKSDKTLVAFIVPEKSSRATNGTRVEIVKSLSDDQLNLSQAMADLRSYLPAHMIPQFVIPVTHVPQTSNGKQDRKALQALASSMSRSDLLAFSSEISSFVEPVNPMEANLRKVWSEVLRLPESSISTNASFYDLGGDSIRIVSLAQRILGQFEVHLGRALISKRNITISVLGEMTHKALNEEVVDESMVDLIEEFETITSADWSSTVNNLQSRPNASCSDKEFTVFLTGATGYLGTEILRQLLSNPQVSRIVALVRCSSQKQGLERVQTTAKNAGWLDGEFKHGSLKKIEIWPGDLSKHNFGLPSQSIARLCGRSADQDNIDAIIHNGAIVNWNADYARLKEANVSSTIRLLRACLSSPSLDTKFVYVSGGPKVDFNKPFEDNATVLKDHIGYSQTKFLSESIVHHIAQTVPGQNRISVVKPGLIIGDEQRGVANVDDFLWRSVATAASLGKYPVEDVDRWLHIHAVDTVASTIISQLFTREIASFSDMLSGMPISQAWQTTIAALGSPCEGVPMDDWAQLVKEQMDHVGESHPMWSVQHFLSHRETNAQRPENSEVSRHTLLAMKKNVDYLKGIGYIGGDWSSQQPVIGRSNLAQFERLEKGNGA